MKILAAVDGSAHSDRMIDYLIGKPCLRDGNEIFVLYAVPPIPHRASAFSSASQTRRLYEDDAEQVLRPIRKRLAEAGLRAHVEHRVGFPAEQIRQCLEDHGIDMLVIGTHGRGALSSLTLGSVSSKLIATCRVPTLLIH